eukprot:m.91805 g.91805  ORF g.91805 m.91805 type:complete len:249 (+) comp15051_c0_seq1:198-944(+)
MGSACSRRGANRDAPPSSLQTQSKSHQPADQQRPDTMSTARIAIIYYSTYGHVRTLAHAAKAGVEKTGATCSIFQVPETLPEAVLKAMHAPDKGDDPVLTHDKLPELTEYDGFLFGVPTRFGMMCAQMKAFFDSTGGLWQKGALTGKAGGVFFSTGTQNGGQETTALTTVTQLTHHGIIFVPPGYSYGASMFSLDEPHGGSPYGAGTLAGADGSRQPSEYELGYAGHQGEYFAKVAAKIGGKVLEATS